MCSASVALKGIPHGVLGLSLLLSVCIQFIYHVRVDVEESRECRSWAQTLFCGLGGKLLHPLCHLAILHPLLNIDCESRAIASNCVPTRF